MVLQPADLPPAFLRYDQGPQRRADLPRGTRGSATRFGRLGGWKARYRRAGSSQTSGPLVIESRADRFKASPGARRELEAYRGELPEGLRLDRRPPEVGDDSFAATGTEGSGRFAVRFYLIVWREGKTTASVLLNGFNGKLTFAQAVELARKQERRMEAGA